MHKQISSSTLERYVKLHLSLIALKAAGIFITCPFQIHVAQLLRLPLDDDGLKAALFSGAGQLIDLNQRI